MTTNGTFQKWTENLITPPRFIFKEQYYIQAKMEKINTQANRLARTKLGEDRYFAS
jgi:hypothetical protein